VCSAPIVPAQKAILTEVNSTFVSLAMDSWLSGGCAVESFDVALQEMETSVWHTVENSVPGNVVSISLDSSSSFVSDIAIFVLKRDVKLQLTNS